MGSGVEAGGHGNREVGAEEGRQSYCHLSSALASTYGVSRAIIIHVMYKNKMSSLRSVLLASLVASVWHRCFF